MRVPGKTSGPGSTFQAGSMEQALSSLLRMGTGTSVVLLVLGLVLSLAGGAAFVPLDPAGLLNAGVVLLVVTQVLVVLAAGGLFFSGKDPVFVVICVLILTFIAAGVALGLRG